MYHLAHGNNITKVFQIYHILYASKHTISVHIMMHLTFLVIFSKQ